MIQDIYLYTCNCLRFLCLELPLEQSNRSETWSKTPIFFCLVCFFPWLCFSLFIIGYQKLRGKKAAKSSRWRKSQHIKDENAATKFTFKRVSCQSDNDSMNMTIIEVGITSFYILEQRRAFIFYFFRIYFLIFMLYAFFLSGIYIYLFLSIKYLCYLNIVITGIYCLIFYLKN